MAVVAALKLHKHVPTSVASGQPNSAHYGLRSGRDESNLIHVTKTLLHPFGQLNFTEVRCTKRGPVEHFFMDGFNDFWMRMPVNQRTP